MFIQKRLFQFHEPLPNQSFRWEVLFDDGVYFCSVVPEKRGNKTYWYMRKVCDGKTYNLYVAPQGKLTEELLDNAVKTIRSQATSTQEQGEVLQ